MVDQKRNNNEFQVSSMDDKMHGGTKFLMKVQATHMENSHQPGVVRET